MRILKLPNWYSICVIVNVLGMSNCSAKDMFPKVEMPAIENEIFMVPLPFSMIVSQEKERNKWRG